jgi:A/G-specific adenine glycosylase
LGQVARALPSEEDLPKLRQALLAWYGEQARELPWRARRGERADPYRVWVSEVMLQQTRVEVVRGYFERWMQELPTLGSLAAADEEQVLSLWQGLGYYSRARRLRQGANFVVRDLGGTLPAEPERLLEVPGIGPYSAGAISSIAFGRETPLVDGNVVRVLCRVLGLAGDPARAPLKKQLWDTAARFVKGPHPGDFNQALMELGATVCTPRRPRCDGCPWSGRCIAQATGRTESLPELAKKPKKEEVGLVTLVCTRGDGHLVEKNAAEARWWAGLWTLPTRRLEPGEAPATAASRVLGELGLSAKDLVQGPPLRHQITRFRVTFHPVRVREPRGPGQLGAARRFAAPPELAALALPAPHRKLLGQKWAQTSKATDPPLE